MIIRVAAWPEGRLPWQGAVRSERMNPNSKAFLRRAAYTRIKTVVRPQFGGSLALVLRLHLTRTDREA